MQKITFNQTHNVFLDNGIVAVYRYLRRVANGELADLKAFSLTESTHFALEPNKLWIHYPDLFGLLDALYYAMGREVYDTYTDKQFAEGGNLFFRKGANGELTAEPFPKMNTYGLTELLTNNAQGTTSNDANTEKIESIKKRDPVLAKKIENEFNSRKLKLLSKVYFNERYTKLTRLEPPQHAYFEPGPNPCYLTGESVKRLVDAQNISPFISGISAFSSHRSTNDKKVSWKALYLSRFAPATCFYQYPSKLRDALNVYLVYSDNLTNLYGLLRDKFDKITRPADVLRQQEYIANFPMSDENNALGRAGDFIGRNENLFYLLHTLYNNVMGKRLLVEEREMLQMLGLADRSIGIVSIRAESFAATMRPNQFENLHHVKFIFALIHRLGQQQVSIPHVWQSLKLIKPSLQSNRDRYRMERQFRERFVEKVLNAQSILSDMEGFFNDCYGYLLDVLNEPGKSIGFKRYNDLLDFTSNYETIVRTMNMETEAEKATFEKLRTIAIDLGKQIGAGIRYYNPSPTGDPKQEITKAEQITNCRQGRKYIVALGKANQFETFLKQLRRIEIRLARSYNKEFLEQIDPKSFIWVKEFILISALNIINPVLSPSQKQDNQNP